MSGAGHRAHRPVHEALTRRAFIGHAALAVAGGMLPIAVRAGRARVLVLGGGLAGLYAALLLEEQGFAVTVLEARRRVGGRVRTLDRLPGKPEGGANIIGPNYGRVIEVARRLGVALKVPARGPVGNLVIDGEPIAREAWPGHALNPLPGPYRHVPPDRLMSALLADNPLRAASDWRDPEFAPHDRSATDHLRGLGLDVRALQLLDVNNGHGNRLRDTSLLSLYRVHANLARGMAMGMPVLEVQGGNSRLPEAMAAALAGPVVRECAVEAVHQDRTGVEVRCAGGASFGADLLVCALPATAVSRLAWHPALPAQQAEAFGALDYHKVTQAHLVVDASVAAGAWQPAGQWTNGTLERVFVRPMDDGSGRHHVTCWINGDGCDRFDALDPAAAGEEILRLLLELWPQARGRMDLAGLVSWRNEPLNRGAWAIWQPGQIATVAALLQRPHGRVLFAGEHTSWANPGMEGAMESGERAALELMRRRA